jgi:hypothetical protein
MIPSEVSLLPTNLLSDGSLHAGIKLFSCVSELIPIHVESFDQELFMLPEEDEPTPITVLVHEKGNPAPVCLILFSDDKWLIGGIRNV